MAEFPSKENFIEKFEEKNKDKYPIINIIINENEFHKKLKLLKYIPIINTLCNYMINYVSYRYTREEAKLILITEVISDKKIIELSKEFTKIYKEIWPYIKNPQIGDNFSDLEENKLYLSNLCLDSHKDSYGFVLLEIYKKMAEWQNLFIDTVIKSQNNNLNSYEDMFNLDISLQDCQEEQILNLPSFEKENNTNLMKIILDNSLRNDNKIIYNYEQIENELASSILPEIKKFKLDAFNKVNYKDEYNTEDKDNIVIKFNKYYPQRNLTDKELDIIFNYLKINNDLDIKRFLFNIQFLINDILYNTPNKNEKLYKIMENNKICNIEIIRKFFNEIKEKFQDEDDDNSFTIDCLIHLIDFVELLFWDKLSQNLDEKYLNEFDENIKNQINNYFDKNNSEGNNTMITKVDLCSVIRRFICRYLIIYTGENINPNNKLKTFLTNLDLWFFKSENKKIEEEINKIFGEIDVQISHAFKLYQYLGGDKIKLGKYILFNKEENNETDNEDNNKDETNVIEKEEKEDFINDITTNGENNRIENIDENINEENEGNQYGFLEDISHEEDEPISDDDGY